MFDGYGFFHESLISDYVALIAGRINDRADAVEHQPLRRPPRDYFLLNAHHASILDECAHLFGTHRRCTCMEFISKTQEPYFHLPQHGTANCVKVGMVKKRNSTWLEHSGKFLDIAGHHIGLNVNKRIK